jgi:L-asparagine oxygenase
MKTQNKKITLLCEEVKKRFQDHSETELALPQNPGAKELWEASMKMGAILSKDETFVAALKEFANESCEYVVLGNMPMDGRLCEPPTNGLRPAGKCFWTTELAALCVTHLAGFTPLSYQEEKGDQLVHQVAPVPAAENTRSNAGKIMLGLHSENAILEDDHRPEALLLTSLINEPETATDIASVARAAALLPEKDLDLLQQPLFRIASPDSFDKAFKGRKIISEPRPIIRRDHMGILRAAGNVYGVKGITDEADNAMVSLGNALADVDEAIVLKPGMALLFNNDLVFHGRGRIANGQRWLQRVFAKRNLGRIRLATQSGPDAYIFSVRSLII